MNAQIRKWGSSLAVRIPDPCVKALKLKEGMQLDISVVDGGILLQAWERKTYTLAELVRNITPDNVHGETAWGEAVGREHW
jgi:antitoxin MazE